VTPSIDVNHFEVLGNDMQILNLKLDGSQKIQSVPGAMAYMEPSVKMEVNCDECLGRCLSGSSCIMAAYANESNTPAVLGLTPNFPAKVIPLSLTPGNGYRCKEGAFFASTGNASVGYNFDFNPMTCCFGGQGCVRQVVSGEGTAFLAAMGTLMTKELAVGEQMVIDTHSLVAWSESVTMDVQMNSIAMCCCGGEGGFNTVLTGPGAIYMQSMSFQKFTKALKMAVVANAQQQSSGVSFGGAPPESDEI